MPIRSKASLVIVLLATISAHAEQSFQVPIEDATSSAAQSASVQAREAARIAAEIAGRGGGDPQPYIDQALALAPDDWQTLTDVGVAQLLQNRFAGADQLFTRVFSLNPDAPPHILLNHALAKRGLGRFDDAQQLVDQYELIVRPTPLPRSSDRLIPPNPRIR